MIQIKSKLDCCGCTACASSCPKSAITMVPDEEGFLYPKIDMRRCIECGACERACPILNKKTVISEKTEGYIIRIKDNKILYESTSGGAFTALADYILEQNGISKLFQGMEPLHTHPLLQILILMSYRLVTVFT